MGYQASWFSGLSELRIVASEYYFIVRIISGFFVRRGFPSQDSRLHPS